MYEDGVLVVKVKVKVSNTPQTDWDWGTWTCHNDHLLEQNRINY